MFIQHLIIFFFFLVIATTNAYPQWRTKAGGGVHVADGLESKLVSTQNQLPAIHANNGYGLHVFLAQQNNSFSIGVSGQYTYFKSKTQYDYLDPKNSNNHGRITNLSTDAYFYNVDLYLSADLFSVGKLHFFVAGGPSAGFATMSYDKSDYERKNSNSSSGLIEDNVDSATLFGYFGEAGFEVRGNEFGGQLKVVYHNNKTGKFVTLSNEKFIYEEKSISFNFFRILK